jgi:hypothetical protein
VAVSRPSSQDALVPRVIDVAVSAGLDFVFVSDDDTSFVSINHPPGPDDASCVACGWNDDRKEVLEELDGVEVVNGSDWKGPLSGWPFWADALNGGAPLALVGGSDDHTVDEHRDATPGSPTTMVFAKALSEASLVEGLKAGRTYVRVRGPNGPSIEFTARVRGRSFRLGDVIPMAPFTTVALEAVVTGAPGQMLEWIRQGEPLQSVAVSDAVPMRLEARARPGDWFSVIVSDEEGPTLMTGAIYTEAP